GYPLRCRARPGRRRRAPPFPALPQCFGGRADSDPTAGREEQSTASERWSAKLVSCPGWFALCVPSRAGGPGAEWSPVAPVSRELGKFFSAPFNTIEECGSSMRQARDFYRVGYGT